MPSPPMTSSTLLSGCSLCRTSSTVWPVITTNGLIGLLGLRSIVVRAVVCADAQDATATAKTNAYTAFLTLMLFIMTLFNLRGDVCRACDLIDQLQHFRNCLAETAVDA